ncbi:MAG TPA: DUF11 domain-containing protein [Pyrinomonadaceae bacterium]
MTRQEHAPLMLLAPERERRACRPLSRRVYVWLLLLLLLFCATPSALAAGEDNLLYGVSFAPNPRVFVIDQTTGVATSAGALSFGSAAVARHPTTGIIYYTEYELDGSSAGRVATFNPTTTANTIINNAGFGTQMVRLAFNSAGTLYSMDAANVLYTVNTANGTFTALGTVSGLPAAAGGGDLAFPPTSTTTAYLLTNGNLYTVNIGARTSALIGATGITNPTGLCFATNGSLYASNLAANSTIYTVDTATATSTAIGSAGIDIDDLTATPKFANLSITKVATGAFAVNKNAVYTLTVTNNGPQAASGPLVVSDTLPSGLAFSSYTAPAGWTCGAAGAVVTCNNPGPMANAATAAIALTVAVTPSAAPNVTNTASVSGVTFDQTPANNSSAVTTPVMYVTIIKSVNPPPPGPYVPGTDLTYTITFKNEGNVDARNFVVFDNIPSQVYFKVGSQTSPAMPLGAITGVTLSYVGGTPTSGGGGAPAGYDARITRITWTFSGGNLKPGVTGTVTFIARIR